MKNSLSYKVLFFWLLSAGLTQKGIGQIRPDESNFELPETATWLGNYGKFRISEKLFWSGELHYRRVGSDNLAYLGRMAQVYNRHGITYLFNKDFTATAGGVLRFDWSPDKSNPNLDKLVLEPRIWHEYLWVVRYPRFLIYHRIRLEHRWSRNHLKGSDFKFRNRWRYKFLMKIPLNNDRLIPGTYYFSPDIELIMQSGKSVIDSPMEDLRIFPTLAYIYSPRVTFSTGMMYTTGQKLNAGYNYRQRWIFRFNTYISLDFRKFEDKIPDIRIMD